MAGRVVLFDPSRPGNTQPRALASLVDLPAPDGSELSPFTREQAVRLTEMIGRIRTAKGARMAVQALKRVLEGEAEGW